MVLYRRGLDSLTREKAVLVWDILGYGKGILWLDRMEMVSRLWHRFRGRVAEKVRVDGTIRGRGWEQEKWGSLEKEFC